jgi:DNA polymerase-3 subunit gamma/tau
MDQFVVSARKYRPATFDTVVGQEAVTLTLKNAIRTGHVAQAFLFTGPRGVGKTTCARILARTINCENLAEDLSPCGQCLPCQTFQEGHSLSIFELDAASNNSVEDIRNLILQVQIAPQVGTKKVYIIDEVHMLSSAAFNAFLKTLEEPPSYAIFILATTEKHKILPTILSRCQVFDFKRITIGDITRHLAGIARNEGIEAEAQALHTIAQKADGGLRDALSIFDQLVSYSGNKLTYQDVTRNLNVLDHEHFFRITASIAQGDTAAALVAYNAILQQGFDGHLFVTGLARHLRDILVAQDQRTLPLLEVSEDLVERYGQQAAATPRALLVQGLEKLAWCDSVYKQSKEPRLLVELTLITLCRLAGGGEEQSTPAPVATTAARPSGRQAPVVSPAIADPAQKKSPDGSLSPAAEASALAVTTDTEVAARPRRRLAGSVSISETTLKAPAPDPPPALETVDEEGMEPGAPVVVNPVLLSRVWSDYAKAQKEKGRNSLHATLVAREPVVLAPGRIGFTIVNEVQEKYLREEKPELLGHLRRSLGDPRLELVVTKEEMQAKPRFTRLDRFKLMAERNPALVTLHGSLDLDLG